MRTILARESANSPTGMSYFTGSFVVAVGDDDRIALLPATSWFVGEAFVLPDQESAAELAAILAGYRAGMHDFLALPHLWEVL